MAKAKLPDPARLTEDQLIERWKSWLEKTETEAFSLYLSRYAWENIQRIYSSNPELQHHGMHIYDWMLRNFKFFGVACGAVYGGGESLAPGLRLCFAAIRVDQFRSGSTKERDIRLVLASPE